jgi:hypothetical protein
MRRSRRSPPSPSAQISCPVDAKANPGTVQHNGFADVVIGIGGSQPLLPLGDVFGGERDQVGNVG